MTTLSNDGRRRAPGGAPRSGGRITEQPDGVRAAGAARTQGNGARAAGAARTREAGVRDTPADTHAWGAEQEIEHPVAGAVALAPRIRADQPGTRTGEAEDGPQLRVAPPAPVRAPKAPFVVLVLALVIVGVVGILVLNTKINENVFRLHDLKETQNALDTQEQQLEGDIAERAAPGTVAGKARELGMQPPTKPPTFIVLPDGQRLGVPQPAVGK